MYQKRIIVCLDVRQGRVTKGVKFQNNIDVGDPIALARKYYKDGADELVFYDITASAERRSIFIHVVEQVARQIFIPFTVGGGIASLKDMYAVLHAGAEKISLNSAAVRNPELIRVGSAQFGSQCIVLAIDAVYDSSFPSKYRVVIDGGRVFTSYDVREWAEQAVELGAGEIVLNSIDADGRKQGYDLRLTRVISSAVSVPVVASGGAGNPDHIRTVLEAGAGDAALIAGMVHSGDYTVPIIKQHLYSAGVSVRLV